MAPHKYRLTYFPVRARGEHLRYLLAASGVEWENKIVTGEEWPQLKSTMVLQTLPQLDVDEVHHIGESMVIGQFLAAELGMAGRDHIEAAKVFMYAHAVNDFQNSKIIGSNWHQFMVAFFGKMDHAAAKKMWQEKVKADFKTHLDFFEGVLKANGGTWLVGDRLSWADLFFAELNQRITVIGEPAALDGHPLSKAHCERVHKEFAGRIMNGIVALITSLAQDDDHALEQLLSRTLAKHLKNNIPGKSMTEMTRPFCDMPKSEFGEEEYTPAMQLAFFKLFEGFGHALDGFEATMQ